MFSLFVKFICLFIFRLTAYQILMVNLTPKFDYLLNV